MSRSKEKRDEPNVEDDESSSETSEIEEEESEDSLLEDEEDGDSHEPIEGEDRKHEHEHQSRKGRGDDEGDKKPSAPKRKEKELGTTGPTDKEAHLEFVPDIAFDEPGRAGSAALPPAKQLWSVLTQIGIPTINIDEKPKARDVLEFIYKMEIYRGIDPSQQTPNLHQV